MSSGRIWYPCRVRHCKSDWPPLRGTWFLRSCLPPQRGERREGGPCRSAEPLADWLPRLLIVQVPPVEGGYCEGPAEVEAAGGLLPRVLLWPLHPLPLQRLTLLQGFWSPLFLLAAGPTDPARSVWSTCFLPALSSPPLPHCLPCILLGSADASFPGDAPLRPLRRDRMRTALASSACTCG